MTQPIYNLPCEPRNEIYFQILEASLSNCDRFSLVIRTTVPLNKSGQNAIDKLAPFLISKSEESDWPGTHLINDKAIVLQYRLCSEAVRTLCDTTNALFSWTQPDLPEDLCLFRSNGECWLVSITHEKDAYFQLSPDEAAMLVEVVPGLILRRQLKL